MPRIPDIQAQGGRPTPRASRPIPNIAASGQGVARAAQIDASALLESGAARSQGAAAIAAGAQRAGAGLGYLGEGLQQAGQSVLEAELRQRKAADNLAIVGARSQFSARLTEAEAALQADPDYQTYEARYLKAAEKAKADIAKTLPGRLRPLFEAETPDNIASGRASVQKLARTKFVDRTKAYLDYLETENIKPGADPVTRAKKIADYGTAVDAAMDLGVITQVEALTRRRNFATQYTQVSISEWFRAQPDRIAAAQQLYDGALPDPVLKGMYDRLPADDRSKIFRAVVEDSSKLMTMRAQARKEAEDARKDAAMDQVRSFYVDDTLSDADRREMFNTLRHHPDITPAMIQSMDKYIREGGRMEDVERDVFRAESAIRRGEVDNEVALALLIGEEDLSVSFNTIRMRLMPMIEARRDDLFTETLRWGQAELGIATGSLLGDAFRDKVDKGAQFEAELRLYRKQNPQGDLWGFAEKRVEKIKKQGNATASQALPGVVANYRAAIAEGTPERIAGARTALIAILVEAALVTPVQAARSDFDPLSVIDTAQEPPK